MHAGLRIVKFIHYSMYFLIAQMPTGASPLKYYLFDIMQLYGAWWCREGTASSSDGVGPTQVSAAKYRQAEGTRS